MNRPELPAHIRREFAGMRRTDRAIKTGDAFGAVEGINDLISSLIRGRTAEEIAAEARYERERLAWNAYVSQIRQERQAHANEAEVAKIRSAACPRCFATHPGEC